MRCGTVSSVSQVLTAPICISIMESPHELTKHLLECNIGSEDGVDCVREYVSEDPGNCYVMFTRKRIGFQHAWSICLQSFTVVYRAQSIVIC